MAKGLKTRKSSPSRFKIQDSVLGYATILPAMLVLIGFFGYPLFYEVYASFTNSTVGQPGEWVGLANYSYLVNDPAFTAAAFNTVVYVTAAQTGKFALGLAVALLLQQKMIGRNLWRSVVLLPYALPGFVAFMVWRLIYNPDVGALNIFLNQIGVLDQPIAFLSNSTWAMPGVVLATIWKGFPFWTIMFLAALQAIPKELYEAAASDGAFNCLHALNNFDNELIRSCMAYNWWRTWKCLDHRPNLCVQELGQLPNWASRRRSTSPTSCHSHIRSLYPT